MLQSIWQDVQQQFRYGNRVTQIILVNLAVFIVVNLLKVILGGGSTAAKASIHFIALSDSWLHNLTHPWTFLSYGFVHEGFWHIGWNMLLFYWFGRIVGDLIGNERVLPVYVWGVLVGGLAFWITALIFPYGQGQVDYIIGASAGVMATIVAAAVIAPDYAIRLILLGEVKIKYIALVLVLMDIFAFGQVSATNQGGHFAHLGGAFMGYFFVSSLRNGRDLAEPINRIFNGIRNFFLGFGKKKGRRLATSQRGGSGPTLAYKGGKKASNSTPEATPDKQAKLDAILEKIKAKGIDSLSSEERDFLFDASKKKP